MTLPLRLITISLLVILTACQSNAVIVGQKVLSFGTLIDITIATSIGQKNSAEQALQEIEQLLKQRHHQWHAWNPGDLSALNASLNKKEHAIVNDDILKLIQLSKYYYQASNGLFNPALGLLIQAWGFHENATTDDALIKKIQQRIPTMQHINIDENQISSNNPFTQLDFGGIAKGLAIQQIQAILAEHKLNNYLINIGGDLYAHGKKHHKNWVAGIQNPFQSGALASLSFIHNTSLFTSGNYQRFHKNGDKIIHHIINPRTGAPSTAASAVTVIHDNPITADVAATTLMIASPSEWQQISTNLGLVDYLIITSEQQIWLSKSMFDKLTFNTELKVHIIDP